MEKEGERKAIGVEMELGHRKGVRVENTIQQERTDVRTQTYKGTHTHRHRIKTDG